MRILLAFVFVVSSLVGFAQFENSKWVVGASFGNQISISDLTLYPNVTYAINSNTIIGLTGSGRSNTNIWDQPNLDRTTELTSSNVSLGLILKKYKMIDEKWYLNLELGGYLNWNENRNVTTDTNLNEVTDREVNFGRGITVGLTPGLTYRPLDWMIIEGNLGYLGYGRGKSRNADSEYKSSGFNSSIQFVGLGVKFIL